MHDPVGAVLDRRNNISEEIQHEEAVQVPSAPGAIDSSELDPSTESVTIVPAGSFRQKQKRWPTSSYLPGYTSAVASRVCPKCGFEAFAWAKKCRCGTPLND